MTFLLSALAHELVMVIVTKKIRWASNPGINYVLLEWIQNLRMYLFTLQVCSFSFLPPLKFAENLGLSSLSKFP